VASNSPLLGSETSADPVSIPPRAPAQAISAGLAPRVAALLFGSGLCALVYQTAWQRQFGLVFGASAAASSAVLGIFLGGLGCGALFFAGRIARHPRPLYYYGNLELGISLSAAATPLSLHLLSSLYYASGGSTALGTGGATLLRLLIAALVMGAPVFLMGGTLPAAARAIETDRDQGRTRVALLYGLNTCGAVLGAVLGTFLLFELLGTRAALWSAAALNVAVALVARALGSREPAAAVDAEPSSTTPPTTLEGSEHGGTPGSGARLAGTSPERWQARYALVTGAVSGFGFLLLELVWYRMLAPILGGSTFTFGLILSVALAGIGLGGYLYSRRPEARPATLGLLAATTALEAVCVILPFALGDSLAVYAALTRNIGSWSFGSLTIVWTTVSMLVVFPAALVSGYQFPLLFALLGRGRARVATDIGRLYAVNTVGSIAGALLGGFVLIPELGAVASWQLVALLFAATALGALALAVLHEPKSLPLAGCTISLAAITLMLGGARGPTAAFRHTPIGAGRVKLDDHKHNDLIAWQKHKNGQVIWERDGIETAVAVSNGNGIGFSVNGKADGSVHADRGTQVMGGLLPALLHDAPRSGFVLGLGTGMTAGWLGKIPGMRVTVAELEPAIGEVARMAAPLNHDVMNQPNVSIHYVDGRELMLTSDARYDMIMSEPSNPYRSGVASLFTRDFYAVVRSRLEPGGIFAQWLQGYEIDARTVRSIARTLRSEFASVDLWQTQGNDLLFIATEQERTYQVAALRERIQKEPYRSALRHAWLVQDVEGVLSHHVASPQVIERLAAHRDPPINSDDRNVVEYAFARSLGVDTVPPVPRLLAHARELGLSRPPIDTAVDFDRVEELRPRAWLISSDKFRGESLPAAARARAEAFALACAGELDRVVERWDAQGRAEPSDDLEIYALALGHAFRGTATPHIAELERLGYAAEAHLAAGHVASRAGQRGVAVSHYLAGVDAVRKGQLPLCSTPTQLLVSLRKVADKTPQLARDTLAELMRGPLIADLAENERTASIHHLAFAQMEAPDANPAVCVAALGRHALEPRWDQAFLEKRLTCLRRAGLSLAEQAEAELAEYLAAGAGELLPSTAEVQSARASTP
jgi:spermidine synthase